MLALVKQSNAGNDKTLLPKLRSVAMPTDHELTAERHRQAYWLRLARAYDPRKPTLADVAQAAGLSANSGGMVSRWENDRTPEGPKPSRLKRVAAFYGLPVDLFSSPPETDEDRLADMRRLAIGAVELEQQDWDAGADDGPSDEDEPDEPPHRQLA